MNDWNYQPALDLDKPLTQRLRRFPREPDMLCYAIRSASALIVRAWLRLYHRFHITGSENLPDSGPFVIISNHTSHLDALCLLSAAPLQRLHQAFPAAAADYFFVSGARLAAAVLLVNAVPFDRGAHARHSLDLCRQLLARDGSILILFPEGTRSTNGAIGEFKPGIGMLLAGTDIPVLPCHLSGAAQAMPKGRIFPRPRRIELVIGAPRRFANLAPKKESFEKIARNLQQAVAELAFTPSAPFESPSLSLHS
jgi:1-acyl-sn-glycerol-3-phosphate acyltransferase